MRSISFFVEKIMKRMNKILKKGFYSLKLNPIKVGKKEARIHLSTTRLLYDNPYIL